jgi:hypothetical protein
MYTAGILLLVDIHRGVRRGVSSRCRGWPLTRIRWSAVDLPLELFRRVGCWIRCCKREKISFNSWVTCFLVCYSYGLKTKRCNASHIQNHHDVKYDGLWYINNKHHQYHSSAVVYAHVYISEGQSPGCQIELTSNSDDLKNWNFLELDLQVCYSPNPWKANYTKLNKRTSQRHI